MEGVIPFEYGFLYKPVSNPTWGEGESMSRSVRFGNDYEYMTNSGSGSIYGQIGDKGIDHEKYYHPIGYIESKQEVVVEVMVMKNETTYGHLYMSSMSFLTTSLTKHYTKIDRANIDVNIFIRNFEKVL